MPPSTPDSIEFLGLRFYSDQASIVRVRDGATSYIRPKQRALLIALLSRPGDTVTYKELWTTIWPEIEDFDAVRRTMTETKSNLDKLLRSILKTDAPVIQTISNQGYRIKASVVKHWSEGPAVEQPPVGSSDIDSLPKVSVRPEAQTPEQVTTLATISLFHAHPWHVVASCTIYSSAYVCILMLETAYSSEQFRHALSLSPLAFSWIFLTSIAALIADWKLTLKRNVNGLPFLILSFIVSAFALCLMLTFFLPGIPVTQASFQTQTAQGAYLKNVGLYFLPLVTVYLLIPFHLFASLTKEMATGKPSRVRDLLFHRRRATAPIGAIYIRPRTLGFLLLVVGIACLPGNYWLLDHLKPSPYMNRFTLLVILRLILYFGLGAECLLWYSRTLNEIKASLN